MRILRLVILPVLIFSSCGWLGDQESQYPPLSNSAQLIYDELLESYNNSCVSCLKSILDDWSMRYTPNTNIPDAVRDVYEVFEQVYAPWDLGRMSDSEWGDSIYSNASYYIVQTTINYGFHFDEEIEETNTIQDFRPAISNDTIHVLFYTNDYKSAISQFLGTDYVPVGYSNSYENVVPVKPISAEEYLARMDFLKNFLMVSDRNWIEIETHPEIFQISFTPEKDSAQVLFNLIYESGEVILKKENDQWDITEYTMKGIS